MKTSTMIAVMTTAAALAAATDPTSPDAAMAERLSARVAESGAIALKALVVGGDGDGAALLGTDAAGRPRLVRRGDELAESVDGVRVTVSVKSVTGRGVELSPAKGGRSMFLPGSFKPLPPPENPPPELLRHLECAEVPLDALLRLVSDQTGVNISASEATAGKKVSAFLRNVTADAAVEEICRTAGLWFRRDRKSGVVRVTTMQEYAESLDSFREETTEIFTLLYPNVVEVASVIYGLYPDRTFLSLGEEEFDEDDENDLSRRFRRFRVLEDNGGSQFLGIAPPDTSSAGSGSGSGTFSYSRGSVMSGVTQWEQLRERRRRRLRRTAGEAAMSADDARLAEAAYRSGDTNLLEQVRAHTAAGGANIFLTVSRKNNALVARTSDVRVMDEIRGVVRRLDVPTPMVLMEVKVLELDIDDDYEATFQYAFNRGTHSVGSAGSVAADVMQAAKDTFEPTMAFTALSRNLEARIKLSQKDGKAKTLATPTLLVANNEVSRIFSGKQYPLVTGWTAGSASQNDGQTLTVPTVPQIETKDIGTMLLITPSINSDKTVTLRLLQENSEVSAETAAIPVYDSAGNGVDKQIHFAESRQLAGTFVAKDGLTVMAGGLVKETESETYWRTPVLGSIPLVGWLFRGVEKVKRRTELIVLITPHVVSTPVEGGRISQELQKALSAHPAAGRGGGMGVHKPDARHSPSNDISNIVK